MTTPGLAPRVGGLPGAVYSRFAARLAAFEGETYPFHVGDTWLSPPDGCRTDQLRHEDFPGLNRYTNVPGDPGLIADVARRVAARTGVACRDEEVVIAAGATGGFAIAFGAIVSAGAEVLILSPAWPLIAGITRTFDGVPVHVPWFGEDHAADDVAAVLDRYATARTVAVYLNTPSNPTGRVLAPEVVEAIARWAVDRRVWLVSDEVYEDLGWGGPHTYARAFAPERTISAWSFSKAYGMAGNRVGYVVGPADLIGAARKLATYTFYCAPHVGQIAARRCLTPVGDTWVAEAAGLYRRLGEELADRLGVRRPDGGTFLFFDLRPFVGDLPMDAFLDRCTGHGLLLAPGDAFGPYPHHVRLCFTAVEPARTRRGVEVLARLLGR